MSNKTDNRSVEVYLMFNGNCEEAVEFYRTAIGATVEMIMRFKDSPEAPPPGMTPPNWENKVMHTSFRVGGTMVMASDGCNCPDDKKGFAGFSLSLAVHTEAEADKYFNALAEGGKVTMPLSKTFWSPRFGMLEDKFGIGWMLNVIPAGQQPGCGEAK